MLQTKWPPKATGPHPCTPLSGPSSVGEAW